MSVPLMADDELLIWCCPECGHWTGSAYMQPASDNPTWRPTCKMKGGGCSRPEMLRVIVKVLDSGIPRAWFPQILRDAPPVAESPHSPTSAGPFGV